MAPPTWGSLAPINISICAPKSTRSIPARGSSCTLRRLSETTTARFERTHAPLEPALAQVTVLYNGSRLLPVPLPSAAQGQPGAAQILGGLQHQLCRSHGPRSAVSRPTCQPHPFAHTVRPPSGTGFPERNRPPQPHHDWRIADRVHREREYRGLAAVLS